MKLEIYNEAVTEPEKVVRLGLVMTATGSVAVHVVDEEGKTLPAGRILIFHRSGEMTRIGSVGIGWGFQLDESRRVKID